MVDFRYHLVSLVSVFLALAIGIILGAGPLQNSIGNALSGEVSKLREDNTELKAENADLEARNSDQDAAINDIAPMLIEGTLTDRTVTIVALPGVNESEYDVVRTRLQEAGANVSGYVTITEAWTSAEQTSYRSSFANQIVDYVDGAEDGSEPNTILSLALKQLVREGTAASDNSTLRDLLVGTESPMISINEGLEDGAEAVVVIAPDIEDDEASAEETPDAESQAQISYDTSAYTALISHLGEDGPTVVAGAADSESDVVRSVRDNGINVSSVDSLETTIGGINVVLAVASELNDELVAYGFEAGAAQSLGERVEAPAPPADPANGEPSDAVDGEPVDGEPTDGEPTGEETQDGTEDPADESATEDATTEDAQ